MKSENYSLIKYEADENKVFDYAVPRYQENEMVSRYKNIYTQKYYL